MYFLMLLAILSLIIIVPLFFIIKHKNQTKNHAISATPSTDTSTPSVPETPIQIELKALPNLFQQMILDIEAQFLETTQKHRQGLLSEDSFFTAKRLFYTRLPEIARDYLNLEPNYAKTYVIDTKLGLTSHMMVQHQLKSILDFLYQLNQSSNQLYLQNILTNQRYLQSVYQHVGMTTHLSQPVSHNANSLVSHIVPPTLSNTIASAATFDNTTLDNHQDSDWQAGHAYLQRYSVKAALFSNEFVQKIGQLVYFSSITQLAIESELGSALAKLQLRTDLELESLSNLLNYQLPRTLQSISSENSQSLESRFMPLIDKLLALLNAIIETLDNKLPLADKLAIIQNHHDDMTDLLEQAL